MTQDNETEVIQNKSKAKTEINLCLLSVAFTVFALIIPLNPTLLKNNILLSLQLTLSIPLLINSIFIRTRTSFGKHAKKWHTYGFITFTFAYGFLVNVIGILLSEVVNKKTGFLFWGGTLLLGIIYAVLEILEDKKRVRAQITQDSFFFITVLVLGILPVFCN